MGIWHVIYVITLMTQIVEHIKISVHLKKFGKDIIVEHLLYTVSIATNKDSDSDSKSLFKVMIHTGK